MPRLERRGMFFRAVPFRVGPCRFVLGRAVSCRGGRCRGALCLFVPCRAVGGVRGCAGSVRGADGSRTGRAGAGWKAGRCGARGSLRSVWVLRGSSGREGLSGGRGCCTGARMSCGPGGAADGAALHGMAGPAGGDGSVQGVRRGGDCECRLYSLSLPRSAAGKCMAAAFRKDFGP